MRLKRIHIRTISQILCRQYFFYPLHSYYYHWYSRKIHLLVSMSRRLL